MHWFVISDVDNDCACSVGLLLLWLWLYIDHTFWWIIPVFSLPSNDIICSYHTCGAGHTTDFDSPFNDVACLHRGLWHSWLSHDWQRNITNSLKWLVCTARYSVYQHCNWWQSTSAIISFTSPSVAVIKLRQFVARRSILFGTHPKHITIATVIATHCHKTNSFALVIRTLSIYILLL